MQAKIWAALVLDSRIFKHQCPTNKRAGSRVSLGWTIWPAPRAEITTNWRRVPLFVGLAFLNSPKAENSPPPEDLLVKPRDKGEKKEGERATSKKAIKVFETPLWGQQFLFLVSPRGLHLSRPAGGKFRLVKLCSFLSVLASRCLPHIQTIQFWLSRRFWWRQWEWTRAWKEE